MKNKLYKKFIHTLAKAKIKSMKKKAEKKENKKHDKKEKNSSDEQIRSVVESDDSNKYSEELGIKESGLDKLIRAAYSLLGLATFFTAGPKEVKAWTFKKGMKAPACAGIIHSDFERGFIKAEVISFEDYKTYGGEKGAKENGKLRLEGKEYVMQDGDICVFRFNV